LQFKTGWVSARKRTPFKRDDRCLEESPFGDTLKQTRIVPTSAVHRHGKRRRHAHFRMLGMFAEFEPVMTVAHVNAGIACAEVNGTRSGNAIGRPALKTTSRLCGYSGHADVDDSSVGLASPDACTDGPIRAEACEKPRAAASSSPVTISLAQLNATNIRA